MNYMELPASAVRQVIKEIDTGEVLTDDQIDEKIVDQHKAISADEQHLLSDPKLFAETHWQTGKGNVKASRSYSLSRLQLRDEIVRLKAHMLQS